MNGQFMTGPVPLQFLVGRAPAGTPTGSGPLAQDVVLVNLLTPLGQQVYYFDIDAAKRIANAILEAAGQVVIAPATALSRLS